MRTPHWPGHCLVCGVALPPRRWWQRGILTPLPLCRREVAVACYARSVYARGPG